MEKSIMNICGVNCYEENGTVYIKLEDAARGLGFTRIADSGNEVVRWDRVDRYLKEFSVPTCGHDDFIPENIFYRLAMKAKNETAEKFQALVADEIIPSIRKHGAYMTPQTLEQILLNPDTIIQLAQNLKAEQERNKQLTAKIELDAPKVEFYDAVADSKTAIPMNEVAKVLNFKGYGRNNLFELLRNKKVLMQNNTPYQKYIDAGYFRVVESKYTSKDETHIYVKTLVLQKGIDYIRKLVQEARNN